ncbi:MAG: redoxin domain-containing protein [Proteobacteria bacterium]|nr:redoxin domain-containing protein [Pseudomonadota bacterium]
MFDICETPTDFSLTNFLTDNSGSLSDYAGKVILLSFMCIRCPACWNWISHMQQIQNDYETNDDVQIVGVIYNYNDGSDGMGHSGPVTSEWISEKLTTYGLTITFPLLMDGPWAGSVAQQYLAGFSGGVGFPWSYIISKNFLITNKWHRLSTAHGELLSFDSGDLNDTEYFARHRLDDLQIDRSPWDTVLVLDYSGSMNTSVTIGAVTQPKIDFLREAAGTLLRIWKDYAFCEDQLGLVYFKNHASTDGSMVPILPGKNIESVIEDITSKSAGGCTAMGAGLATGIDILETSPNRRFIVLFSDGMQNRNPLVYVYEDIHHCFDRRIDNIGPEDYPEPLTSLCGPDGGQSDYSGSLPVVLDSPMNINIHTIGIGVYGLWQNMLNAISLATFGRFNTATDIWPNLKEFFLETLVELYRGSSLQVVAKKQGTLEVEQQIETFLLNKSVKKATILLSWVGEEIPLTFKLRKDGQTIDLRHKVVDEQSYRFATLAFPHYQKTRTIFYPHELAHTQFKMLPTAKLHQLYISPAYGSELISPDGGWEVVIERVFPGDQTPVPYHLMILADDKKLEYAFEFPREIHYTGKPIPLSIKVLEDGKPIERIYSAEVTIHRPTVSLGNILSKYKVKGEFPEVKGITEDFSPIAQKLEMLLQDKEAAESLKRVERDKLKLQPVWKAKLERRIGAKGLFRGFYAHTQVPGVYRLDFRVKGVGSQCGIFERTESRTVFVQAKPDREATKIKGIYKEKEGRFLVTVAPTDKFGNLVGPGYSQQLQCRIEGKLTGKVIDKLDGSYQIELKILKKEDLNRINAEVNILGEKIYEGLLRRFIQIETGDIKK